MLFGPVAGDDRGVSPLLLLSVAGALLLFTCGECCVVHVSRAIFPGVPGVGRSSRNSLKKGLGRRGKSPEKVHVEPVMNQTPDLPDLAAPALRDIARVPLHDLLWS